MNLNGIFQNKSGKEQILLFMFIVFISSVFGILISEAIGKLFFSSQQISLEGVLDSYENTLGLKIQLLITSLFIFLIPVLFFVKIVSNSTKEYLQLNNNFNRQTIMIVIVIMMLILPFIAFMAQINETLISMLPHYFDSVVNWMKIAENDAKNLTIEFLKMDNITDLLFNLILIAIIPAVGEELFFRGVLQKLFIKWTTKKHFSILITAFLFSSIHIQFFGFLPRFVLGALLGYFFLFSKNIWIPIIAHFFNNAMVIIVSYSPVRESINTNLFSENIVVSVPQMLISVFAVSVLFYLFYKSIEVKKRDY